ncbi:MAG: 4Fe-4S binding protein [Dehalococcoidia bacterium]|nr:4Fe-4S binding protein [Dehalococcoidia bacterium]MDZ4245716.1 4Fe-4S binding protein [Dehalococcoidia bacterium]
MTHNIYEQLAFHLSTLGMGYPFKDGLVEILKENFTPEEAQVALLLPTKVAPLQVVSAEEIAPESGITLDKLRDVLDSLTERGLLFSGKTKSGEKGYALQQVGFGFPQTFFWKGEDTPAARRMTELLGRYFKREVTEEAYGSSATKPYRYVPAKNTIEPSLQAVYPYHTMESVINQTRVFAVTHCPCRVVMKLRDRGCNHPLEVCLKFDDLAEYVIERGLARQITREEALDIIKKSEEAGLVHFVDNALGNIKHCCNCCGCACWNVGSIRRRKIPRDVLMATFFLRDTDREKCTACGDCVKVCPVNAVVLGDDFPEVDEEWCIGCGICVAGCPSGAARLKMRPDREGQAPLPTFEELFEKVLREKGLK